LTYMTSHELAKELLNRPDKLIKATYGNREYNIRDYQIAVDKRNYDDSTTYWRLNLCSEQIS